MATKLPPQPVGVPPGHSFWNDWYEKIRDAFNSGQVATTWANIDFSGSNITDIVSRSHENLQGLQGGTAGEHNHLTNAQHTTLTSLPTIASGTYTPTLTGVANVDATTPHVLTYIRIGNVVTVGGRIDVDATAAATFTQVGVSLPIPSNFSANDQVGGSGAFVASGATSQPARFIADAANDRAELQFTSPDNTNRGWHFTFQYEVI